MADDAENLYAESQKKMLDDMPEEDKKKFMDNLNLPDVKNILEMLKSMDGVSEDEKNKLRRDLLKRSKGAVRRAYDTASLNDYAVFIVMVVVLLCVFVFFGYKLYKSLVEKQHKREEKQKLKQQKKKK